MRIRSLLPASLSLFGAVNLAALTVATLTVATLTMPACGANPQGAVMLAMQTDMKVDTDISAVGVYVTEPSSGRVIFSTVVKAVIDPKTKQNTVHLPATLALYTQSGKAAPIRIRMVGFRYTNPGDTSSAVPTVINEALTTVPTTSVVRLPMSLSFVNRNTVQGPAIAFTDTGVVTLQSQQLGLAAVPTGEEYSLLDQTCPGAQILGEDGECTDVPEYVPADLPLHSDADVFGGGTADGSGAACFDTVACLRGGRRLQWEPIPGQPNDADASELSFRLKGDPIDFSTVAVVAVMRASAGVGLCPDSADADGIKKCFVALDSEGPDASGKFPKLAKFPYRFDAATGTLKFKKRFFARVKTDKDFLGLFVTNPVCGVKTRGVPTCDAFPQAQKHHDNTDGAPPYLVADAAGDSSADPGPDASDAGDAGDPNAPVPLSDLLTYPMGLAVSQAGTRVYCTSNTGSGSSLSYSLSAGPAGSKLVTGLASPAPAGGYRVNSIASGAGTAWDHRMILTNETSGEAYSFDDSNDQSQVKMSLPEGLYPVGAVTAADQTQVIFVGHDPQSVLPMACVAATTATCASKAIMFTPQLSTKVVPTAIVAKDSKNVWVATNAGSVYLCNLPTNQPVDCTQFGKTLIGNPFIVDIAYNGTKLAVLAVSGANGGNGDQVGDGIYLSDGIGDFAPFISRTASANPTMYFEKAGPLRNTLAITDNGAVVFSTRPNIANLITSRLWSATASQKATPFGENYARLLDVRAVGNRVYYIDNGTGNGADGRVYGRAIP